MATHNAPVTRAGRFGDWLAKAVPWLIEAVVIVAAAGVLAEVEPAAGVWLLLTGLFAEALLVAWKSMRAPWDRLADDE